MKNSRLETLYTSAVRLNSLLPSRELLRIYDVEDSELLFSPYQSGRLYSVVWMRDNYVMEMRGKNIEKVYK